MNLKKIYFETMCTEILDGSEANYYVELTNGNFAKIIEISLIDPCVCCDEENLYEPETWLRVKDVKDFWKRIDKED